MLDETGWPVACRGGHATSKLRRVVGGERFSPVLRCTEHLTLHGWAILCDCRARVQLVGSVALHFG